MSKEYMMNDKKEAIIQSNIVKLVDMLVKDLEEKTDIILDLEDQIVIIGEINKYRLHCSIELSNEVTIHYNSNPNLVCFQIPKYNYSYAIETSIFKDIYRIDKNNNIKIINKELRKPMIITYSILLIIECVIIYFIGIKYIWCLIFQVIYSGYQIYKLYK